MSREVLAESAIEGDDDERNDHDRENRVRRQDREIDGPHDAGALKPRRAVVVVIDEIRREKEQ